MAAMNFPSSPSDGATFISDGGVTYIYNSAEGKWKTLLITADDALPLTGGGITGNLTVSGTVGVGTTSPATKLAVIDTNGSITFGNSSSDEHKLSWNEGSIIVEADPANLNTSSSIQFKVDATERLRIDSSGRVGVGTSTAYGILTTASTGINLSSTTVNLGADGANGCIVSDTTSTNNTGVGYWFRHGGLKAGIASSRVNTGNWGTDLRFYTHPTTTSDVNNVYERMRIDPAGNVGVGTTSPTQLLHVAGNIRYTGDLYAPNGSSTAASIRFHDSNSGLYHAGSDALGLVTAGSEKLRIDSSGRVGIGSSTPSANLYVKQSGTDITAASQTVAVFQRSSTTGHSAKIAIIAGNAASSDIHFGDTDDEDAGILQYNHTNNNFNFNQALGIGTTSPARLLQVGATNGEVRIGGGSGLEITHNNSAFTTAEIKQLYATTNASAQLKIISGHTTFHTGTSNTERARIDSSGRLLVGTSTYAGNGKLVAAGNTGGSAGTLDITWTGSRPTAANTDIGYIRWYVAENSSSNAHYASIYASSDGASSGTGDIPGRLVFSTTADGASSPTERMRVSNNGDVYIGPSASYRLDPWGESGSGQGIFYYKGDKGSTTISTNADTGFANIYVNRFAYGGGGDNDNRLIAWYVNGTQQATITTNGTSVSYNTGSDYRLKQNVVALTGAIDRVKTFKPIRFNWIDPINPATVDGFLAHEAAEVVPEAVDGEKDGLNADGTPKYQQIDQSKLVPLLTAALQEAIAKIETLEARVAALEAN